MCLYRRRRASMASKATPLPRTKVIVVGSVLFVNQFGSMMLFPFLPFMVHDFFPHLGREELGRKAGFLGSAFFLGNFIGSFAWGWASDVFGRKPIMLLGLMFTISTELLFGFSQNFAWAVSARFLWGLLNGNLGVAKTYISEVCDDSNQAKGFSVIGTSSGIGRLMGSVVGGFLSQPASKYSVFETPFFCKFPYVLPCLVGALISVFSLIAGAVFLEETLHKAKGATNSSTNSDSEVTNSSDSGIELTGQLQEEDQEMREVGDGQEMNSQKASLLVMESDVDSEPDVGVLSFDEEATSDTELLINEDHSSEEEGRGGRVARRIRQWSASRSPTVVVRQTRNTANRCRVGCGVCVTDCLNCTPKQAGLYLAVKIRVLLHKLLEVARLIKDRKVLLSTTIYGVYGGIQVMTMETFPLLMVTCYQHGGYHMDGNELGVVIMCSGVVQLLWQLLVYPHVAKRLGYRRTLQLGIAISTACTIVLPFSSRIAGPLSGSANGPCNNGSSPTVFSGSGSGGSGIFDTATLDLNATDANSTQYCQIDYVIGVNDNSIARLPFRVWIVLLSVMILLVVSRISGFVSVFVLIGNSSLPEMRGSVNGVSQSLVAISRSVAPVVGSLLFAWSASNGYGWPLDFHFVFNLVAVFSSLLIFISLFLPKSIEKKRERPSTTAVS